MKNSLYDDDFATAQVEHKQPVIVRFFILQCAKLRMLYLYNFFTKICDVNEFEELEMNTDSLYLAHAEK